jgi:allantoin racemase
MGWGESPPIYVYWHADEQFVVACFSAHPLVNGLRELTSAPVHGILEAPLLFASTLGSAVGILTTSPRWVPLLKHDVHSLHLSSLNTCGIVSSGLSVLDLENLPREQVIRRLSEVAKIELDQARGCDVIVLGCAGMVGLEQIIRDACTPGMTVLDPVRCAVELCGGAVRMGVRTSKAGIYAPA